MLLICHKLLSKVTINYNFINIIISVIIVSVEKTTIILSCY